MQNHSDSGLNSTIWEMDSVVSSGLMGLCFIVGVPGNIAVILFIFRHFKKDNFAVRLMLNLAVADIMCLSTLPVWIYNHLFSWSAGLCFCKLVTTLVYCSVYSSLITVTMLSLYRCIKIRHPQLWSRMSRRRERGLIIAGWTLALLFSCPAILEAEIIEIDFKQECERTLDSDTKRIVAVLESVLGFFVPFTIMLVSYYCIHKAINQGAFKHRWRSTKLVTRIVIVFFIFWAPYHIIKLMEITIELLKSKPVFASFICEFAGCLTFINSMVNPLLYAFSSKSLHKKKQAVEPKGTQLSRHEHSIPVNNTLSQLDT